MLVKHLFHNQILKIRNVPRSPSQRVDKIISVNLTFKLQMRDGDRSNIAFGAGVFDRRRIALGCRDKGDAPTLHSDFHARSIEQLRLEQPELHQSPVSVGNDLDGVSQGARREMRRVHPGHFVLQGSCGH